MPLSSFLMSVGQFVLLGNWIIEGDFKRKWNVMRTSKVLWVMSSFYLLHLIGLLWTSDFAYASNDLRIKLPLLWFPLLFITSKQKPTKKEVEGLLWLFVSAVFIATIVSTLVWLGLTKHKVVDIRDISIFNSHIRFALMIVLVICFLIHGYFKSGKWFWFLIKAVLIAWFVVFLGIMQSFTGIVILGVVIVYYSALFLKSLKRPVVKVGAFLIIGLFAAFVAHLVIKEIKEQQVPVKPIVRQEKTINGNKYYNNPKSTEAENGNLIWANVCADEIEAQWNKRSSIKFLEKDKKGNEIGFTIIRYLSSKGLNKDSTGISMLSKEDIALIEKGTTNYLYTNKSGIEKRIHEVIYEYDSYKQGKDPTGHSFMMRLEFWRVGMEIIKRKWLCGVGTGDVQRAYTYQYVYSNTKLNEKWRLRSHNQFMAITISFGIIGLIVFLMYLFYPIYMIKQKHFLFGAFILISLFSMLNEDTLETQAGATFFGFFYCFLIFFGTEKSDTYDSKNNS
ncbi:MAG: O-antigen ligase family protein [Bacteroidota bacterium]|nr:O-antigen ligase family protein [Bacteroidota bacterium]